MNNNPNSTPNKDFLDMSPEELGGGSQTDTLPSPDETENNDKVGSLPSPDEIRGEGKKTDGLPSPEELGYERVEKPEEPEQETEDNFFANVGSTLWNVASKQIPATLEFMKSAVQSQPRQRRGQPLEPGKTDEEYKQEDLETRKQAFKNASQKMQEFQKSQENKVTQVSEIGDAVDLMNYVGNTVAQSAVQIPASILTGGGSSVMQEIGLVYMDQVNKIAEKEGITPEEVIGQGLDDQASAAGYGIAAGMLDYLGAKGATKSISPTDFKSAIRDRAVGMFQAMGTEGFTEGGQSIIEQFGGSRGAGDSFMESILGVNPKEVAEEAVAGAVGGTGVNTISQVASKVKEKARQSDKGVPEGFIFKEDKKTRDDRLQENKQKISKNGQSKQERVQLEKELAEDGSIIRDEGVDPIVDAYESFMESGQQRQQQKSREVFGRLSKRVDVLNDIGQSLDVDTENASPRDLSREVVDNFKNLPDESQKYIKSRLQNGEDIKQVMSSLKENIGTRVEEDTTPTNEFDVVPPSGQISKQPWEMTFQEFEAKRPAVEGYQYHGSPEGDISEFDPNHNTNYWREGSGVYTTDSRDQAARYAKGRTAQGERQQTAEEQGRVNYIKPKAENVFDMSAEMDNDFWNQVADDLEVTREVTEGTNMDAFNDIKEGYSYEHSAPDWEANSIVEEYIAQQYEATTHKEGVRSGNEHNVTVYKPTAEGGVAFDLTNPKDVHRETVKNALENGEDVPESVLRDYPDLAQEYNRDINIEEEAEKVSEHEKTFSIKQRDQDQTQQEEQQSTREEQTPSTITVDTYESPGRFKQKFREWFLDRGNLPKNVFNRKLQRDQKVDAELQRMRFHVRDLNKAMNEVYEPKSAAASALSGEGFQAQQIPKEAYTQVNNVLRGNEEVDVLPNRLQEPTRKIRTHVDRLSNKLIEEGVVEGKMGAVVDENIGVYMNRSYRLHDDPKWAEKVPSDIRNQAKAFIRDQYESQDIDYTEQQINNKIDDLLYNEDAPMAILSQGMKGSKDISILKEREDIAPEIRALMGEYTDPIVNYSKSVYKMANLLESHKYLTDVRDQGTGNFLFEENDPNRPEGFNAKIAADGSDVMSPLNGLMTAPEIKESFEQSFRDSKPGQLVQWYLKANSAVKYGKTVGSVTTHLRNIMGGAGFAIANGHMPNTSHFKESIKRVKDSFVADNKVDQDRVVRLKELGILADGANVGEMKGYLKDANFRDPETVNDIFSNIERNQGVFGKGRKLVNTLTNLYQAEDNLLRTFMFESEAARYEKAMPDASRQEIEELAADIVSRTYQNYDRVPKSIQAIRKIPVVGTFASFPAEVIRTSVNTAVQAKSEIQSDNSDIRKIGWRRAAGLSVQMGIGTAAAQAFSQAAAGVLDGEDDALRRFMPPWSRNSSLFYTDKTNKGARYMNMSYTDPHEYLKKPINAMLFSEDAGTMEGVTEGLREMFQPFLGEEILFQRIADIRSNAKSTSGTQIYNPQAPLGDQAASATGYLWEAFEPGTITQGKRLVKAYHGVTNDYGKKYNVSDEVLGFFGFRISEVDVEQSLKFKGFDYSKQISNARRIHTKHKYRKGNVDEDVLEGSKKKANMSLRETWKEAKKDWDAAYRLGVSNEEIKKSLKEGNLPKWFIESVDNGDFKEFDFDS